MRQNLNAANDVGAAPERGIERDPDRQHHAGNLESTLAAIVTFSTDAIYSIGADHIVKSWNAGAERLFGYRAEEVVGRLSPAVMPESRAQIEDVLRRVLEGKQTLEFETRRLRKDGAMLDVAMTASPIFDKAGAPSAIAVIARDITERKRAEREHALLAALVNSSDDAIVSLSTDLRITSWNLGAQKLLGYTPQDAMGQHPVDLLAPAGDRAMAAAMLTSDFAAITEDPEVVRRFEARLRRNDGALVDATIVTCGIRDPHGELIGLSVILRDDTERKRAERGQALLAAIVESSDDPITSISPDSRITSINPSAEKLFGLTAEQAIGQPFEITVPPQFREITRRSIAEDLAALNKQQDLDRRIEVSIPKKDGTVADLLLVASGIFDRGGTFLGLSQHYHDITARKRAEHEQALLASIVQGSDSAIFSLSLDFRILSWNAGAKRLFDYSAEETIGRSPFDLFVPLQQREFARVEFLKDVENFRHAGATRSRYREWIFARKNGRPIETSLIDSGIYDAHSNLIGISIMVRDTSGLKRAAREHALLAAIVESSDDAIVSNSLDLRITSWNKGAQWLLGYTAEEAVGRPASLYMPPEMKERGESFLKRLVTRLDQAQSFEVPCLCKDGSRVDTWTVCGAIRDHEGKLVGFSAIHRDITERKRAERETVSLAAIVNASHDAIMNVSSDAKILSWNPAAEKAYGFTAAEAVGKGIEIFVPPDELAQTLATTRRVVESGEPASWEQHALRRDGTRFISAVNIFPIRDAAGNAISVAGIGRDITALKDNERQLVAAREAALAASRAKSEFLSSMSHEIRTPMTAILGMAELLSDGELNAEQRRYIETLCNNGHALLDLINSILDLAKVESGRLTLEHVAFDLTELVERAAQALAIRAHAKRLELIVAFAPGVPTALVGDPLRLRQILINLIGNAIKFTEKGEVLVSVEPDCAPGGATRLKFSVRDSGIGIAEDKLPVLFAAFAQADSSTARKYGGSGLGLAIVKRLVGLMQGAVAVQSALGKGSVSASVHLSISSPRRLSPRRAGPTSKRFQSCLSTTTRPGARSWFRCSPDAAQA